jgi:hypothetical protein
VHTVVWWWLQRQPRGEQNSDESEEWEPFDLKELKTINELIMKK